MLFKKFETTKRQTIRLSVAKNLTVAANYFRSIKIAHAAGWPHRTDGVPYINVNFPRGKKCRDDERGGLCKTLAHRQALRRTRDVCTTYWARIKLHFPLRTRATLDPGNKTTNVDGRRAEYIRNTKNK